MFNHYFLSRFEGVGTKDSPFRAVAARLGSCSILDLRPDQTKGEGWCFACVTKEIRVCVADSYELIYIGEDGYAPLPQSCLETIKRHLAANFQSTSLDQILAEILLFGLLPGRGLRPQLDGSYKFQLGGLTWEASEKDAFAFVGRLREPTLLSSNPPPIADTKDLRPILSNALIQLAAVTDSGQPDWIEREILKVERGQSTHPLARHYIECRKLLSDPDSTRIAQSADANWVLMLAQDIHTTRAHLSKERLASRFRNPKDCEPTKYELYVMASYIEAGIRLQTTDSKSTGEFKAFEGVNGVHIECKHKNLDALAPRRVIEVFDKANLQLREVMKQASLRAFLKISSRTDPIESDVAGLIEFVSSSVKKEFCGTYLSLKYGSKFEIEFIPSSQHGDGMLMPTGLDYGFTEGITAKDSLGVLSITDNWGIGWTVSRPGGWIRSVIESVRQAASQLPSDSANIAYIHIPTEGYGAMTTRLDAVVPEIKHLLSATDSYKRINAIVLSGQAILPRSNDQDPVTIRYIYRCIKNATPRTPLPEKFRIFGADFTRGRRASS